MALTDFTQASVLYRSGDARSLGQSITLLPIGARRIEERIERASAGAGGAH